MEKLNENNFSEALGRMLIANYENKVIATSDKVYVTLDDKLSIIIKISKIVSFSRSIFSGHLFLT